MKFALEIPEKWDNAYALREAAVHWIFTVNEKDGEGASEKDVDTDSSFSDASVKDPGGKAVQNVKTGDISAIERAIFIFLVSGAMVPAVLI